VILGIVGSEQAKFTVETERLARLTIRRLIIDAWKDGKTPIVVSGECHLGGVDIFAKEEASSLGCLYQGFAPKSLDWTRGYKPRNMQIARASDRVVCITIRELPVGYTGMRFKSCYHCCRNDHVKSGGCWTVKYAKSLGKVGDVVVVG